MNNNINQTYLFLPIIFFSIMITLTSSSPVLADDGHYISQKEPQNSFTYIGGTIVTSKINSSNSDFGLGVDALYLRKIWGGFSIGLNANFTFGLSSSEDLNFNPLGQTFTGKSTQSSNIYTVSLVLGGIAEHNNGGRLAYFIGPMIGGRDGSLKTTWDMESAEFGVFNSEGSSHVNLAGLTAGLYYKFPGSGWTAGLNANANLGSRLFDDVDVGSKVSLSIGYTF